MVVEYAEVGKLLWGTHLLWALDFYEDEFDTQMKTIFTPIWYSNKSPFKNKLDTQIKTIFTPILHSNEGNFHVDLAPRRTPFWLQIDNQIDFRMLKYI